MRKECCTRFQEGFYSEYSMQTREETLVRVAKDVIIIKTAFGRVGIGNIGLPEVGAAKRRAYILKQSSIG